MDDQHLTDSGANPAALPETVSAEPQAQAATPVQVEQPKQDTPHSQSDIEKRLADLTERMEAREREMREELRRTRQSVKDTGDSIVTRVREEYSKQARVIDGMVSRGLLSEDQAVLEKARVREQVESEQITPTRAQPQAQAQPNEDEYTRNLSYVQREAARIRTASGIDNDDPEFAKLPTNIPYSDPDEAVQWYRKQVDQLKKQKSERVTQAQAQIAAAKANAQKQALTVDTGAGGAVPTVAPEEELARLINNPPSDPRERMKWRNRIEVLSK